MYVLSTELKRLFAHRKEIQVSPDVSSVSSDERLNSRNLSTLNTSCENT